MHLVATNLSLWIRTVIWESANEWIHHIHRWERKTTWHVQAVQLLLQQLLRQQQHRGSEAVKLWAEIWNFTRESWSGIPDF